MMDLLMSVVISLLRGVNLGSHNRIKMDTLRTLYESLKLRHVQTYVQSGNVVFTTGDKDLVALAKRIENGIERTFGFRPVVILRTTSELRAVVTGNPFVTREGIHPSRLLVMFLANDPGQEAREKVLTIKTDPEELRMAGREIFIHYPNGMGRSKLSWIALEKVMKTSGTGRNWNSVTKLLEIAKRLESESEPL